MGRNQNYVGEWEDWDICGCLYCCGPWWTDEIPLFRRKGGNKGGREREEGRRTRTAVAMKVSYLWRELTSPFVSCKMPVRCVRAEREFMGLSGRDARGSA